MAPGTPEPRLRGYNLPQAPRLASGLIETNRSKHQTSYHIEMLGISVNNGRLERDRSVGIYPLEIRMNLFRIHIRPDGGTDDMVATFQYCLDNGLLGVGWRVKGLANTEDWEVYKLAANQVHGSIQQPCYIFQNVRPGDLVWTRDPFGQYYLARVIRSWEYWMSPEGQEQDIDIANVYRCEFSNVELDAVPGTIISSFARGKTIQRIHNRSALAYSQYLWNHIGAGQLVYDVDDADFPDIFTMLDSEETEDLVFLYLQRQGWYVVPNSRKRNTLRFEFMLTHSETGEKALTQVKTGDERLDVDCYSNHPWRVFLFQSNEYYDGHPAGNVTCIARCDLTAFLRDSIHLFPQSIQTKWEMLDR